MTITSKTTSAPPASDGIRATAAVPSYGRGPRADANPVLAVGFATNRVSHGYKPNWYKSPIIDGFERGSRLLGVDMVFFNGNTTADIETSLPAFRRRCDGLLVFGYEVSTEAREALAEADFPVVTVGEPFPTGASWHVDIDNELAFDEATSLLVGLGHRRIAALFGKDTITGRLRRDGFRAAAARAIIPAEDAPVSFEWSTTESGRRRTLALLDLPPDRRPTAFICFNDLIALGVLAAACERGLRVPDDLSVIGTDDLVEARLARPALTTIRQPLREIGEEAVRLLIDRLEGRVVEPDCRLLRYELVERGSTGPAPAGVR